MSIPSWSPIAPPSALKPPTSTGTRRSASSRARAGWSPRSARWRRQHGRCGSRWRATTPIGHSPRGATPPSWRPRTAPPIAFPLCSPSQRRTTSTTTASATRCSGSSSTTSGISPANRSSTRQRSTPGARGTCGSISWWLTAWSQRRARPVCRRWSSSRTTSSTACRAWSASSWARCASSTSCTSPGRRRSTGPSFPNRSATASSEGCSAATWWDSRRAGTCAISCSPVTRTSASPSISVNAPCSSRAAPCGCATTRSVSTSTHSSPRRRVRKCH